MSAFRQTSTVLIALFALGLACIYSPANAGPGHRAPGWGPRPPMHRPVPPPPPMRPRIHHSGWHSGWYWGPLAAGATLWGLSELIDSQRYRNSAPTQVIVPVQPQTRPSTGAKPKKDFSRKCGLVRRAGAHFLQRQRHPINAQTLFRSMSE